MNNCGHYDSDFMGCLVISICMLILVGVGLGLLLPWFWNSVIVPILMWFISL